MILFLVGFVSLLGQVVLLRELNVAFYGIELAYLVALAAWLAGTAAGAALVPARFPVSARAASVLLAVAALLVPLDVAFVRASRLFSGGVPGAYLPIERQLAVLVAAAVPLACSFGLAFRWAARLHGARGGSLARAYAIESLGAAAGGLVSTLAFRLGAQTFALALLTTVAAWAGLAATAVRPRAWRWAVAAAAVAAALGVLAGADNVDRKMTRWTHRSLIDTRDTPYARISVSRNASQVSVFENDVLTYDSETADNEALPHLAALQHPRPARVLLLGGGAEQIDRELAQHRPLALVHLELDRVAAEVARQATGTPPGAGLLVTDPRAFLAGDGPFTPGSVPRSASGYDLVVIAMPEPVSGQTNRFYTREFFRQCAARMSGNGVLALRLHLPENYLAPTSLLRAGSVARALRETFRFFDVLPASPPIVVASQAPLPDAEVVQERLRARAVDAALVTPGYVTYLYTNDRRQELRDALARVDAPTNRDAQPVSYLYASIGWLSKFVPSLIGEDVLSAARPRRWPAAWRWGIVALVALVFAVSRLHVRARRAALAFAAGLVGMVLETVVLLDYQAKNGALFEDLGLLVMAFMAGSAVGAWRIGRLLPRQARRTAALLLVALSGSALVSAWLVVSDVRLGLAGSTSLLGAIGALVGGVFSCASTLVAADDEGGMGRLYGADLVGGCLGAVVASLVLVPLGGLDTTGYAVAAFAALALLGV